MQALIIGILLIIIIILIIMAFTMENVLFAVLAAIFCIVTAYFLFNSGIDVKVGVNETQLPDNVTIEHRDIREELAPNYNNYFGIALILVALWLIIVATANGKGADE